MSLLVHRGIRLPMKKSPAIGRPIQAFSGTVTPARENAEDVSALTADNIIEIARRHGVRDDLDGRLLSEKLSEWRQSGCDRLVGYGVENQPYACSAWCVLKENAAEVYEGLTLAATACGAEEKHLAVCPLSGDLSFLKAADPFLYTVHEKYPAAVCTKRAKGKTVRLIGVQALLALYRAAAFDEPQTETVVTVTGEAVATPQNVRAPFGTPVADLLKYCGLRADPTAVVIGDVMTGRLAEEGDTVDVGTTCLVALSDPAYKEDTVCIGCGRCVQVCHADLLPFALRQEILKNNSEKVSRFRPELCDGCGACSSVCPAGLDLTKIIRNYGKEEGDDRE